MVNSNSTKITVSRNPKIQVGETLWTKDKVKELLKTDAQALYRAIILIYNQQTKAEKVYQSTITVNGVGFTAFDSEFLSSIARQLLAGKTLTVNQVAIARNKMLKYACQLLALSPKKGGDNE